MFRIRIRIVFALPDPDPYWGCGSGSRSKEPRTLNKISKLTRFPAFQNGFSACVGVPYVFMHITHIKYIFHVKIKLL